MKTTLLITSGLLFAAALNLSAAPETAQKPASTQKVQLDESKNCFRFGDKTVQVAPSGYIRITKSDKLIATVYFFGNTPYSSYFDNVILEVKKFPRPYSKKRIEVSSFSVDKEQNAFIVKGKVPYQTEGETELLGDYTQTVSLTPENKLKIRLEFTRPESVEKGFLSMFCSVPQAKTYENAGDTREFDKNWRKLKKQSPVNVNCIMPADSLRITCLAVERLYAVPGKQINFASIADKTKANTRIIEIELDLLNGEEQK